MKPSSATRLDRGVMLQSPRRIDTPIFRAQAGNGTIDELVVLIIGDVASILAERMVHG